MAVLLPAILCGGAGSRLWPVSRECHPKPFIQLSDGQSLLQKAFLRAAMLPQVKEVLTVTNQALFFKTQDEYRALKTNLFTSYLLEPCGRNTAAAIAASALYAQKTHGDDTVLLVLAADHLIQHEAAFAESVTQAIALAEQGYLVTFGIPPTHPETGYGYIQFGEALKKSEAVLGHECVRFVEKPTLEIATEYLASGEYVWNAGIFCMTVSTVLHAMEAYCPLILAAVRAAFEASPLEKTTTWSQCRLNEALFETVLEKSFDYAVMEPASLEARVAVVQSDIGWKDLGSWRAFKDLVSQDAEGNCVDEQVILYDTANCYVHPSSRLVGLVGVQDLMVIDTPDALLVLNHQHAEKVKDLYATLKSKGHESYQFHRTVYRPWGTYTVLDVLDRVKIKRIEVNPGASLSLQMHHHRSEHWVVVSGTAKVTNQDQTFLLRTDESTYIAAGHKHRLENPGMVKLIMIEVQSGEYLGEDDIVRFQDEYGRLAVEV